MRVNGLTISYADGKNTIWTRPGTVFGEYPTGSLLCQIFQGENLDAISQKLRGCINGCPMNGDVRTQDSIEDAERYVLEALLYSDFFPARWLAQGSFIRCMEFYS